MQPTAANIERKAAGIHRPRATADTRPRFQHNEVHFCFGKPPPGSDASRTGTDYRDIDFRRRAHEFAEMKLCRGLAAGRSACDLSKYGTRHQPRAARIVEIEQA